MNRREFLWSGLLTAFFGRAQWPRLTPPSMAPPQLRTLIGGNCDANGNLTIKDIRPASHFYAVFTLVAQVSDGAPQWMLSGEGAPYGFAGGAKVTIGAVYTNPGERLTLVITGAAPSAVVTGALYGFFGAQPEDLPTFSSASSGGGLGALPGGQLLGRADLVNNQDALAIACGSSSYVAFSLIAGAAIATGSTINVEGTPDDKDWIGIPWFGEAGLTPFFTWTTTQIQGPIGTAQPTIVVATAAFSKVRIRLSPSGQGVSKMTWVARAVPGAALSSPIGQNIMANSQPVVIASDQSSFQVNLGLPTSQLPTYFISVGNSSKAIGAGGVEQLLAIYHPATVAETLRIRRIVVTIESNSVASILTLRIRRLNGAIAPSGGTAVGVLIADAADPALNASDVFLTYPTTKGTVDANAAAAQSYSVGISTPPTDVTKIQPIVLYDLDSVSRKSLRIRPSIAEGFAVEINSSAASTVVASVLAELTNG